MGWVVTEYEQIAQEAADSNHLDNLFEFVKLNAQIGITEEDKYEEAALAFCQSIYLAFAQDIKQIELLEQLELQLPERVFPTVDEIAYMVFDWVDYVVHLNGFDVAADFYKKLFDALNTEFDGHMQIFLTYFEPLRGYFEEQRTISLKEHIAQDWANKGENN